MTSKKRIGKKCVAPLIFLEAIPDLTALQAKEHHPVRAVNSLRLILSPSIQSGQGWCWRCLGCKHEIYPLA